MGGTYGGNPLACVAAIEAVEIIRQPEFLIRVNQIGNIMHEVMCGWMDKVEVIGDVRGLGSMMLVEFVKDRLTKEPAAAETLQIIKLATSRGVVLIRAGLFSNGIRLLPPLVISDEQLYEGLNVLGDAIQEVAAAG